MTIEIEGSNLPPLRPRKEPLIAVTGVVAVAPVRLVAGNAPKRAIRAFYGDLLGFEPAEARQADFAVRFDKWRIEFERTRADGVFAEGAFTLMGKLALQIRQFDSAIRVLSDRRMPLDLMHYDMGLSRAAMLFDPSGNLVTLIEARPL